MTHRGRHLAPRPKTRKMRFFGRAVPLALALVMVMAAVAVADTLESDTDGLEPFNTPQNRSIAFGSVCVDDEASQNVLLAIQRQGSSAGNTFKDVTSAVVDISAQGGNTGASAAVGVPNTIAIPAGWQAFDNNSDALTEDWVTATVTLDTGAPSVGQIGGNFTFRATGTASNNGSLTPTRNVTWTATILASTHEDCNTAPTNTAPSITSLTGPTPVNEHVTEQRTYTFAFTDPDTDDTWSFVGSPSCGTGGTFVANSETIDPSAKTGEFKCVFDDGPASPVVSAQISDGTASSNTSTLAVTVNNVAPTASASASSLNALSGVPLSFSFSATDPSNTDTLAGFEWRFNDGSGYGSFAPVTPIGVSPATPFEPSATYAACGIYSATAQAKDKDSGVLNQATVAVSVYDGDFHGAVKPAMRNMVQKGRVIPVQIKVGCNGSPLNGLSPEIQLQRGDLDSDTGSTSWTNVVTESVSGADTGGMMRAVDGGYIYNLLIPSNAAAGQQYTIKVSPWGGADPSLTALIEIRK